jgi:transposase
MNRRYAMWVSGACAKVHMALEENPPGGNVVNYRGRRGNLAKILRTAVERFWQLAKRLERGRL